MTQTQDSFDDLAEYYAQYGTGYAARLYDQLEEIGLRRGLRVLDVGCGTAIASEPLIARGLTVVGIDSSTAMLSQAGHLVPAGDFKQGRAEELPFRDKEFDAVICAQSIYCFDQQKALAEMIRVTKPGGLVAVWWKILATDEPIRVVRAEASAAAGVDAPSDVMPGSFRAFYGAPFGERFVRVVPHQITTDTQRWIGYESSLGQEGVSPEQDREQYYQELEALLEEKSESKPFQVRFTQFLYVGQVAP